MVFTPDYASWRISASPIRWLRGARFCAIVPMVGGFGVLGLFALTAQSWLIAAGLVVIAAGLLFFVAGLVLISWYHIDSAKASLQPPSVVRRNIWLTGLLLLLNFPAAIACAYEGAYLAQCSFPVSITIINRTSGPIDRIALRTGLFSTIYLGPIPRKSNLTTTRRLKGTTNLRWTITTNGASRSGATTVPAGMSGVNLVIDDNDAKTSFEHW